MFQKHIIAIFATFAIKNEDFGSTFGKRLLDFWGKLYIDQWI